MQGVSHNMAGGCGGTCTKDAVHMRAVVASSSCGDLEGVGEWGVEPGVKVGNVVQGGGQ